MAILAGLRALPMQLVLLLAAVQTCEATIAAWITGIGPQILHQNMTTGQLRYSFCNSFDTPIYSYTEDTALKLSYPAKNGTTLAGVGWWDNTITV